MEEARVLLVPGHSDVQVSPVAPELKPGGWCLPVQDEMLLSSQGMPSLANRLDGAPSPHVPDSDAGGREEALDRRTLHSASPGQMLRSKPDQHPGPCQRTGIAGHGG